MNPDNPMPKTTHENPNLPSARPLGSALSDYNPAQCLRAEVDRFKSTNLFTPMLITGFYLQSAVVLNEHRDMVLALKTIRDYYSGSGYIGRLADAALPMSESRMPNAAGERLPAKDV